MTRFATILLTLTASALFCQISEAADANLDSLNSRMIAIESRLGALEKALLGQEGDTGSYSYQDAATLEATRGTADSAPDPKTSETYIIKDGDTLGSIARKNGVERSDLLAANRLSEGQPIYIGETLLIPGGAPAPEKKQEIVTPQTPPPAKEKSLVIGETKKPAAASNTHIVAKGDTLTAIAKKYGTQVPALKSANGLKNDVLILGQKLTIPAKETKVAKNSTAPAPAPKNEQDAEYEYENPLLRNSETYGYYSVRKGDNLYALARDFFSNMAELQRLNRLGNSTLIHPGDELIVPTSKYNAYHTTGDVAQR